MDDTGIQIKWQYYVLRIAGNQHNMQIALNSLGGNGWELVSTKDDFYIFKRIKI